MAWVDINLMVPHPVHHEYNAVHEPRQMNATNSRVALVFQVPKTGTLDQVEFRVGTVTSAQDIKVSFQNMTADGDPDGTADEYRVVSSGSISSDTWIAPGLMTSDGTDVGTKRSVTQGDFLTVVFEWDSTTGTVEIDHIRMMNNMGTNGSILFPYTLYYNGSAWVHDGTGTTGKHPCMGLKYDDGTYGYIPHCYPISDYTFINGTTRTFDVNTSPDERGTRFKFPIKVRVFGCWLNIDPGDADFDVVLYEDDDTVLDTISYDLAFNNGPTQDRALFLTFDSQITLEADTFYRLTVKPTTTSDPKHMRWHVNSAALQEGFGQGVKDWVYTQRTDGGSWTNIDTERWWGGLLINAIDVAAGLPSKPKIPMYRRGFSSQNRSSSW